MCNCNGGVSGLGIDIDWTKIGVEQATDIIKKLPEQDILSIIRSLPYEVQAKICGQGIKQEVSSYIPWVVGGGAVLLVAYMLMK
jgi:hypothetical protein